MLQRILCGAAGVGLLLAAAPAEACKDVAEIK